MIRTNTVVSSNTEMLLAVLMFDNGLKIISFTQKNSYNIHKFGTRFTEQPCIGSPWNYSKFVFVASGRSSLFNFLKATYLFNDCSGINYYVRQRDSTDDMKCQPHKWLSPDLERHEIIPRSFSLLITNMISAIITCYIINGGWSTVCYNFDDYTWIWWCLNIQSYKFIR
jgi:hypothetical protein